jgi:phage terminase large subunit GpA-like protein
VNLFIVGVDAAKDVVLARLKVENPGPGCCHFPTGRDAEYFAQLTAERVHTRYVKGFPTRVYVKDASTRNEALDLRVYAYAALKALNVNWPRLQAHLKPRQDPPHRLPIPAASPRRRQHRSNRGSRARPATSCGPTSCAGDGRNDRDSVGYRAAGATPRCRPRDGGAL